MARPLRISYPGAVYHVTARATSAKLIARDERDRQRFVDTLACMVDQYHVRCHAWVLMSNHYHLLLEYSMTLSDRGHDGLFPFRLHTHDLSFQPAGVRSLVVFRYAPGHISIGVRSLL
jgi:hypothetical protein